MKKLFALIILLLLLPVSVSAHSGMTDSNGGHKDGSDYHYHHGYPAHDHDDKDGDGDLDCPYDFHDRTGWNSGTSSNVKSNTINSESNPKTSNQKTSNPKTNLKNKTEVSILDYLLILALIITIIILIIKIKSLNKQILALNTEHKFKLDSISQNLTDLNKLLIEKHGARYLEEALSVPKDTIMQPDGFPSDTVKSANAPWGDRYTVYMGSRSRNYVKYHRLACRYSCGDMPVNIVSAKENCLNPCSICRPEDPDLSWVYKYRKIKNFMDAYVKSK